MIFTRSFFLPWRPPAVGLWLALAAAASAEYFQGSAHKLEYEEKPIQYSEATPRDAVFALQRKLAAGEAKLKYDEEFGYLPALLDALKIPRASQTLVFSKTSVQRAFITPRNPRAIYFNDDVYLGYVPGAPVIEIATADPQLGGVFYRIDNEKVRRPRFVRDESCLSCHGAQRTLGVPGFFVRSIGTDTTGELKNLTEVSEVDHCTPFAKRWAGWYVTGVHGSSAHRGNLVGSEDFARAEQEPNFAGNLQDLSRFFYLGKHLRPTSDVVALMVLEHQAKMHNYFTRLRYETEIMMSRYGHIRYLKSQVKAALRYLLFAEEAPLAAPVAGLPEYTEGFMAAGPFDSRGRSLRQFDLQTRLFKYPCSFLIYSDSFTGLPQIMRDHLLERLFAILTGQEHDPQFARLSAEDRQAVLEILRETKPDLPAYWKQPSTPVKVSAVPLDSAAAQTPTAP